MELPELPDDNIFDILSRLPVKSLMRFKCVSKPWCSLISDPKFIKAHLCQQGKMKNSKILLSTQPRASILDYEDCQNSIAELNYPFAIQSWQRAEFVGSCDGLVCLLLDDRADIFILWNPSTREFRKLPPVVPSVACEYRYFYGIGYDSSIEDYKVVVGIWPIDFIYNTRSEDCEVQVLALKSNEWKSGRFHELDYQFESSGALVNGKFHWISDREPRVLLSFSISEEKFMEVVPLPAETLCEAEGFYMGLYAFENSLFLGRDADASFFEVWEKNMNAGKDSWRKLYRMPSLAQIFPRHPRLCFTRNHKLVLSFGEDGILTYDLESRTRKDIQLKMEWPDYLEVIVYQETLVSPN